MTYTVVFSKLAREKFNAYIHADRKIGQQLAKAIDRLAQNPRLGVTLRGEWKGYLKYRTGRYRIIYRLEHQKVMIFIVTIDDRKNVYR